MIVVKELPLKNVSCSVSFLTERSKKLEKLLGLLSARHLMKVGNNGIQDKT